MSIEQKINCQLNKYPGIEETEHDYDIHKSASLTEESFYGI